MTLLRIVSFIAVGITASACAGGNAIDSGVPQAAIAPVAAEPLPAPVQPGQEIAAQAPAPVEDTSSGAPRNTGTFPNLNDEPARSTNQLTDAERDALMAEMQALQAQQQAGRVSAAAYQRRLAELKRLAATHSSTTIERIEGQ